MSTQSGDEPFSLEDLKWLAARSQEAVSRLLGYLAQAQNQGEKPKALEKMVVELKKLHDKSLSLSLPFIKRNIQRMMGVLTHILEGKLKFDQKTYSFLLFSVDELTTHLNLNHTSELVMSSDLESIYVELMACVQSTPLESEVLIPLDIFHEEYGELVEEMEKQIALYKKEQDAQALPEVKRSLHTLKGSARLVGFASLGNLVHEIEDFLDNQSEQENFALLEQVVLFLKNQQQVVFTNQSMPSAHELFLKLNLSEPSLNKSQTPSRDGEDRLRLKLSQLEKFSQMLATSNSAGAHIEQQLGSAKFYLSNMHVNLSQLDELSRSLEYHSDLMLSKQATAFNALKDYDPLEMDRYTVIQQWTRDIHEANANIQALYESLGQVVDDLEDKVREQNHSSRTLEHALTHVRMIQFETIVPRLQTMVKQISQALSKEVQLTIVEAHGEIDRSLLDRLIASFEHMLRNSIDHGIETKERRLALNKPPFGRIEMSLVRKGSHVMIKIKDDGRGLNLEAIRRHAIEKGYLTEKQSQNTQELINMIFRPGFSTSKMLTSISGRGIGLDVAHAEIRKLGGSLRVRSEKNKGAEFTIQLPFTASLNRALVFQSGFQPYAILTTNVSGLQRVSIEKLLEAYHQEKSLLYMDKFYSLAYIGEMLEQRKFSPKHFGHQNALPVIYIEADNVHLAIIVDQVIGPTDILVKSLGLQMHANIEFLGASVMGDGQIVFILEPLALFEMGALFNEKSYLSAKRQATVLIVDDSITIRKVTSLLLERHHYQTVTAKDGQEALEVLQKQPVDCVLLDIEMPRMDGFSLLEAKNRHVNLESVPVIMISSRSMEKYKKRAFQLGAHLFLSKPFQDSQLLMAIEHCLRGTKDEH